MEDVKKKSENEKNWEISNGTSYQHQMPAG